MNIDIYFRPTEKNEVQKGTIGSCIESYNDKFPDWEESDVVFFTIYDSNNKQIEDKHPIDPLRQCLNKLYLNKDVKISDLGVFIPGDEQEDTVSAIKEITSLINSKGKLLLIIGGDQYLTYANFLGYQKSEQLVNLVVLDQKVNLLVDDKEKLNSSNFLNHILLHEPSYLFNFSQLAHQQYYISNQQVKFFDDLYFDLVRLGALQNDIKIAEPHLRNADLLSIDMSVIRKSEFNSAYDSGPNGLFGNEVCQLMKYAGISDKISCIGIHNFQNNVLYQEDAMLIAQMMYFLITGFSERKSDFPIGTKQDHLKYVVFHEELNHNLVFHKSPKSDRWWLEVPYPPIKEFKFERHHLIPCDMIDYQNAQSGIIPDLWWRTYRKLN